MKITLNELKQLIRRIIKENIDPEGNFNRDNESDDIKTDRKSYVATYVALSLDENSKQRLKNLLNEPTVKTILEQNNFIFDKKSSKLAFAVSIIPPPAIKLITATTQKEFNKNKEEFFNKNNPDFPENTVSLIEYLEKVRKSLGAEITFTADKIGASAKAVAVQVNIDGYYPLNKFLHITIGLSSNGTAKDANEIQNFIKIPPIQLKGNLIKKATT